MNQKDNLKQKLPVIILAVLFVLSLITILVTKGLSYSQFEEQIIVSIAGDQEKITEFINTLSGKNGAIRIDRPNNMISFQNVSKQEVDDQINDIVKSYPELKVTSSYISELQSYIAKYTYALTIIAFATVGFILYKTLKLNPEIKNKYLINLLGTYIATVVISNIILFGTLSFLSRFYLIREFDLLSFLIMNIFIALIFYRLVLEIKHDKDIKENMGIMFGIFKNEKIIYIQIFAIILVIVGFALTTSYVIHGVLVGLGIIISIFTLWSVFDLFLNGIKLKKISFKKSKVINKVNVVDGKEVVKFDEPVKKKKKKKKKKK